MDKVIDFSNCQDGMEVYKGSDHKISVLYNGEKYMLKFPDTKTKTNELQTSHVNSVFSEYIGSHIMQSMGLEAHKTLIGICHEPRTTTSGRGLLEATLLDEPDKI